MKYLLKHHKIRNTYGEEHILNLTQKEEKWPPCNVAINSSSLTVLDNFTDSICASW